MLQRMEASGGLNSGEIIHEGENIEDMERRISNQNSEVLGE